MTQGDGRPRKVLAVVDGSDAQTALRSAAALADRHSAALEVFGCVEPPHDLNVLARLAGRAPGDLLDELCARHRAEIDAHLTEHLPGRAAPVHLSTGKTFVEIIRHVIARDIDFVVKTAEPLTGLHRLLFASTDQHLLRKCPCPVWLQKPDAAAVPRHVLAAVDVDLEDAAEPETLRSLNRRVIETARLIAAPSGAQMTVLHAWDAIGEGLVWAFSSRDDPSIAADRYVNAVLHTRERAMTELVRETAVTPQDDDGPNLVSRLVRGSPEQVIETQSRNLSVDVIVMGTVARTGLSGVFIGNTAENIINSLECPVLAVKPDGFVSPLDQGSSVGAMPEM